MSNFIKSSDIFFLSFLDLTVNGKNVYTIYNEFELWHRFALIQDRKSTAQKKDKPSRIFNTDLWANAEQECDEEMLTSYELMHSFIDFFVV